MKKKDLVSIVVYLIMIAIAVVIGITVLSPMFSQISSNKGTNIGFAILFVIAAIIFNALLIELGHVVGAKTGGYKIVSFNVLGFCFYRTSKKWKFKFKNFDGLTGETKIMSKKENSNPTSYAIFPFIVYAIELALFLVLYFVLAKSKKPDGGNETIITLQTLFILFVTIGGMIELYNIFPCELDSANDGYRIVIFSKKENKEAYNELLRIEGLHCLGEPVTDMKVFDKITNFTCLVNLYSVYKYLGEKNYAAASEILDNIIKNKKDITKENYCSALAQKMYIILLNQSYEEVKKYYDEVVTQEERRFISNDITMQSIRAYLLISSMLDISENEARLCITRYNKAIKNTPAGRVDIENELYKIALDKVDQVRPEWKIKEKRIA